MDKFIIGIEKDSQRMRHFSGTVDAFIACEDNYVTVTASNVEEALRLAKPLFVHDLPEKPYRPLTYKV